MTSSRIAWLEERLREASATYYVGTPIVDDLVYDAWRDELASLCPTSHALRAVGAPITSDRPKVRHKIPMGSLNKVQTPKEMRAWSIKLGNRACLMTDKLDGLSVSLEYQQGRLVQALTRGDGIEGEDVTPNVTRMRRLDAHTRLDRLPNSVDGLFRGEIILFKEDHRQHFAHQANTRNSAAGTVRRSDGAGCEFLYVLVYQIAEGPEVATAYAQILELQKLGFRTPEAYLSSSIDPVALWSLYQESKREALPYDIDGLVITLNDLAEQYALGETDSRPNGAVAFKFLSVEASTELLDIIWQVGGTGRITPVAVFREVDLLGTKVNRASLYNIAYIRQLGLDVGAQVIVARANDVIPRVVRVTSGTGTLAQPPQHCPVCASTVERDGEYLVCPNTSECPAQTVGRLKQWIKELGVLEWGEALLQQLVEGGLVSGVADLYRLDRSTLAALPRMGDKSAENVLRTLQASRSLSLAQFLGAQSIPLCATSTLDLIVDSGLDTLDRLQTASLADLEKISGVGPKRAAALHGWLRKNASSVQAILDAGVEIKARAVGSLTGKSVCFTGKSVRKRAELEQMAVAAGGSVKDSVGKGLTYLVLADPNSTTSKAQAARKNGTTCISEDAFVSMCGGSL